MNSEEKGWRRSYEVLNRLVITSSCFRQFGAMLSRSGSPREFHELGAVTDYLPGHYLFDLVPLLKKEEKSIWPQTANELLKRWSRLRLLGRSARSLT